MAVLRQLGKVQNYAWGVRGEKSLVADLQKRNAESFPVDFTIKEGEPYAELWFGCHPSGPSEVLTEEAKCVKLNDVIDTNLSYLLKVLSVEGPLSLQVHPNKKAAERLNRENPAVYVDDEQKAEIAIALSDPFEALVGFRDYSKLKQFCSILPEIVPLIEPVESVFADAKKEEEWYKSLLHKNLNVSEAQMEDIHAKLEQLDDMTIKERCAKMFTGSREQEECFEEIRECIKLVIRLNKFFPNDVGLLSPFYLNYVKLRPGQCVYVPADTIHAYMKGTCLECMVNSDNVIRAGLTPKFKDQKALLETLEFKPIDVTHQLLPNIASGYKGLNGKHSSLTSYKPPYGEFCVHVLTLQEGDLIEIPFENRAVTALVLSGKGKLVDESGHEHSLFKGRAYFTSRSKYLTITNSAEVSQIEETPNLSQLIEMEDANVLCVCLASGALVD